MRIIMMGTGPFAVPTFRELLDSHHEIVLLVASPLRFCRGKLATMECPMRKVAEQSGMPIFDPEDVNTPESVAKLRSLSADIHVVCDYGQILSNETLGAARLGGINLHGSLLPKYRGAAPINWAIYHGETESGVTVIHMTPKVDAGPCIAQASTPIGPNETAVEVEARLCELGAPLILETLDRLASGGVEPLPQDPTQTSRAPRLKKTDGVIDWNRPVEAIRNHIRAMEPWPKTYTFWHRSKGIPVRVILGSVVVLESSSETGPPGTVLEAAEGRLVVAAAAEGAVLIENLQPAGKRMLSAEEFLRGYRVQTGERFGPDCGKQ